jgi:hypothetical protein
MPRWHASSPYKEARGQLLPAALPDPEVMVPSSQVFAFTLSALALAASPGGRDRITLLPALSIPTPGR